MHKNKCNIRSKRDGSYLQFSSVQFSHSVVFGSYLIILYNPIALVIL